MINAHVSHRTETQAAVPVRKISSRGFWLLFAIEGLLLAGLLALALQFLLPARSPLTSASDYAQVRSAIQAAAQGSSTEPLVEVAPGVNVPQGAVGGFELHGYTYYYYREGQQNVDPLSRGAIARDQVEMVSREQIGNDMVVTYRMSSK